MTPSNIFAPFIDNSRHLFFSYDLLQTRFSYMNTAFATFFNASLDTDPLTLAAIIHPEDSEYLIAKILDSLNGEALDEVKTRLIIDNQEYHLCISASLQTDEFGGKQLTGMIRDITVETEYINTLLRHNTRKNGILNILAHDLAGPIGIIDSMSGLLQTETSSLNNAEVDSYISIISKTSKSCAKLIREFIDHEFLESAEVKLLKARTDLVAAFGLIVMQYAEAQENSGKTFEFESNMPAIYADIDHDKFMQVIHNLISNSLKFTGIQGLIRVALEMKGERVIIAVKDNGIGIPPQFHDVLFDKFTKARRPGLNGEPSIGLGMSIIKTIVEWHNGTISFTSNGDEGTTFYIDLPVL